MKVLAAVAALCMLTGLSACDSNDLITGELEITDLIVGTGLVAAANDSVRVYYVLTRTDDDQLCDLHTPHDNAGQPQEPLGLSLTSVIDGFRDGLVGAREGGRRRIIVPPNLGYGLDPPTNQNCIRSNEFLDFTIDLVEVIKP